MKKLLILLVFIVVSVCLAGVDVLLVNYVFSPEGEQLMERLTEYVQDGDWTELTNHEQPGDICLFVKEFWIPKGIDPTLRSFTVTFAVVEQPFGDYAEYVPISKAVSGTWYVGTEAFILDSKDMASGLWEAIERIDTQLYLFLASYGNLSYEDAIKAWEDQMEAELESYCVEVVRWIQTPKAQGGMGPKITNKSTQSLAEYLGFEEEYLGMENHEHEASYSIAKITADYIELTAHPLDDSYIEGPFFTGKIDIRSLKTEIIRNPAY